MAQYPVAAKQETVTIARILLSKRTSPTHSSVRGWRSCELFGQRKSLAFQCRHISYQRGKNSIRDNARCDRGSDEHTPYTFPEPGRRTLACVLQGRCRSRDKLFWTCALRQMERVAHRTMIKGRCRCLSLDEPRTRAPAEV